MSHCPVSCVLLDVFIDPIDDIDSHQLRWVFCNNLYFGMLHIGIIVPFRIFLGCMEIMSHFLVHSDAD